MMDTGTPKSIGKYDVLGVLGRGGMGVVYRAQDPRMGRQVAIKTLTAGLSSDAGMLGRFYREAEKMGMLKHPNIITVYDLGEQSGFPYIVMEFVEGEPLDETIKSGKPVPLIQKLRIIEQVCSALGYAHHRDVVHRDVKPANVIVRPDGVAKLLDFGIARQEKNEVDVNFTATGGVIGTVPYMPPERLRGAPFDGRSDIFATGVMLFQFLTGRLPFLGDDLVLVNQLLNDRHPPLKEFMHDLPDALEAVVDRSLAKDPSERYQTAEEMAADLFAIVESLKQEHSGQLMAKAEKLVVETDFLGARETLMQLIRSDNQHTRARKLLIEVNQHISYRALAEQAQRKQSVARDALRERRYDEAIALLEEASSLVPEDTSVAEHLRAAQAAKRIGDQVVSFLRQADAAKRGGNFDSAKQIVQQALELDSGNSRLRAAYRALVKQAEDAAGQVQARALLDAANAALRLREFAKALDLAKQAELIDPSSLDVQAIVAAANDGLHQEERRQLLDEIESEVSSAVSESDVQSVGALVQTALDKSPSDPSLLRYHALIDRRRQEFERRRKVDELAASCRSAMDVSPEQALAGVRKGLGDFPGEERLVAVEALIEERLARKTAEERRDSILLEAQEALKRLSFSQAVAVLQSCPVSLNTPEIEELLEFAREEERHDKKRKLVSSLYIEGRALLDKENFLAAERLLSPALNQLEDASLQGLLSQAITGIAAQQQEDEAAIRLMNGLLDAGAHERVATAVASFPTRVAKMTEVQRISIASREIWTRETEELYKLGRAYAVLDDGCSMVNGVVLKDTGGCSVAALLQRRLDLRRAPASQPEIEDDRAL